MTGALVLPETMVGIIEASTTPPQHSVFPAGENQRDTPEWSPGVKDRLYKTTVDCLPGNSSSRRSIKITNVDDLWRPWLTFLVLVLLVWNGFHIRETNFGPLVTVVLPPLGTGQLQACQQLSISGIV
ncbi:hypothetical protein TNCV_4185721 [Trichonephila clavipes]|nr:hypothetical protein TNCV_4185721 [Trichonephila clavipes]